MDPDAPLVPLELPGKDNASVASVGMEDTTATLATQMLSRIARRIIIQRDSRFAVN